MDKQTGNWTTDKRQIDLWMDKLSRKIVEPTVKPHDEQKPSLYNFLINLIKFYLIQNNIMIKLY